MTIIESRHLAILFTGVLRADIVVKFWVNHLTPYMAAPPRIFLPAEIVETGGHSVMSGHGTHVLKDGQVASVCAGYFNRIGSVVSVTSLRHRYRVQQADVIVGRVVGLSIEDSEWVVDVGAFQHARLPLSSVMEQARCSLDFM